MTETENNIMAKISATLISLNNRSKKKHLNLEQKSNIFINFLQSDMFRVLSLKPTILFNLMSKYDKHGEHTENKMINKMDLDRLKSNYVFIIYGNDSNNIFILLSEGDNILVDSEENVVFFENKIDIIDYLKITLNENTYFIRYVPLLSFPSIGDYITLIGGIIYDESSRNLDKIYDYLTWMEQFYNIV